MIFHGIWMHFLASLDHGGRGFALLRPTAWRTVRNHRLQLFLLRFQPGLQRCGYSPAGLIPACLLRPAAAASCYGWLQRLVHQLLLPPPRLLQPTA